MVINSTFEEVCASHSSIPEQFPRPDSFEIDYANIQKGEQLGQGGFATVYKAVVDTGSSRQTIALKEAKRHVMTGEVLDGVEEAFETEEDVWPHFDHKHIVTVLDWDTEPHPWIALEYAEEGHLGEFIQRSDVDLEQLLWIGICITRGVRYAHKRGVMHFDLKPENILFRATDGTSWAVPKVSDWGLAAKLLTHEGDVEGLTLPYAAPEQYRPDEFGGTDEYTDVYQLGALLYALLTGRPPVTGNRKEIEKQILNNDIEPPSHLNPSLPTAVDRVVMKALRGNSKDRYEDVLLLQQELETLFLDVNSIQDTRQPRTDNRRSGIVDAAGPQTSPTLTWQTEGAFVPSGPPAVVDETVYLTTRKGTVHLFGVYSGDVHWGAKLSETRLTAPVVHNDRVYVIDRNGVLTAISLDDEDQTWQGKLEERVSAPVLIHDDTIFLTTVSGSVLALDFPHDVRWQTTVPGRVHGPSAVRESYLYIPTYDGIVAIEKQTGTTTWTVQDGSPYECAPAVAGDILYAGGRDGLRAIDSYTGKQLWTTQTGEKITGVAVDSGQTYVSTAEGRLLCLDTETGDEHWRFSQPHRRVTPPTVGNQQVFVGLSATGRKSLPSRMDDVYAIDAEAGTTRWSYATESEVEYEPVIAGDLLLVVDSDGTVYALQ